MNVQRVSEHKYMSQITIILRRIMSSLSLSLSLSPPPLSLSLSLSFLRPEDRWGRSSSLKTPQHIIRRPSLGFDAIPSEELAEILASIDYKLFRRIPVRSIRYNY